MAYLAMISTGLRISSWLQRTCHRAGLRLFCLSDPGSSTAMIPVLRCMDKPTGVVSSEHAVHVCNVNLDMHVHQVAFFFDILAHDEHKEACLKAIGAELHFPIKQIEVPFEAVLNAFSIDIDTEHDDVYSPVQLHLYTLKAFSKLESALAVAGDPVSIVMNTWPDHIDLTA